jgi:hypothetical protein
MSAFELQARRGDMVKRDRVTIQREDLIYEF